MSKQVIQKLSEILEIMKRYENHTPPIPEAGCFYKTYNSSIVFVFQIDDDGEARAVILRGGYGDENPGDHYWLSSDGYHRDKEDVGPHLVMTLSEKLDIELPIQ